MRLGLQAGRFDTRMHISCTCDRGDKCVEVCCTVLWCNKGLQHSEAVDLHLSMCSQVGQPGGCCQLGFPHASQKVEVHYLHARS